MSTSQAEAREYICGYLSARGYIDKSEDGWYSLGVRHSLADIAKFAGYEYRVDPSTLTQYIKEFVGATVVYDTVAPTREFPKNVIVVGDVVSNPAAFIRGAFDACGRETATGVVVRVGILTPNVHAKFLDHIVGVGIPYTIVAGAISYDGASAYEFLHKITTGQELVTEWILTLYHKYQAKFTKSVAGAKFVKLLPNAMAPYRKSPMDAGWDLHLVDVAKETDGGRVVVFRTGIAVAPPAGFYFEIVPRSSLGTTGWALANSVGIIDQGYRGEIMVALRKCHEGVTAPALPWRAVQLILRRSCDYDWSEVTTLDETSRGDDGGLGSRNMVTKN